MDAHHGLKVNRDMRKLNVAVLTPTVHSLFGTWLLIVFRLVVIHTKILIFTFQSSLMLYTDLPVTDDFQA